MNYAKTALLLAAMTGVLMMLGYLIGGPTGTMIAFGVALVMNIFSYWNSDKMVLSSYGAREVDEAQVPELYRMTKEMAQRAGLPMPRLYMIDSEQPNAFATGRSPEHAAIAVNTGLLNSLSMEEVAGVVGHEMTHIKNHDTLIMTMTATIAGAISMLGNFGMFFGGNRESRLGGFGALAAIIVAPIAAMIVQMAISRTREYAADRGGALLCGNPLWLASGLKKIAGGTAAIPNYDAERNPASAHLFIINPLSGERMDNLFSTHPDTDNRIAALIELSQHQSFVPLSLEAKHTSAARGPWG